MSSWKQTGLDWTHQTTDAKVGRPYLTRRIVIEVSLSLSKGSEMIGPSVFLTSSNTQTEIQVLNQFLM
jgi:hypothetical protein